MPDTARRYTVEEVLAFPDDGNRYEVIHGKLFVSPAPRPRHQAVFTALFGRLYTYLQTLGRERSLFSAPADITSGDETLVQPDILVVPEEEVTNDWKSYKTLLLAVEILSASTARADRTVKRALYQQQQVATYWIVDADAQVVEVWHPTDARPSIVTDLLTWRLTDDAPPLEIKLEELFTNLPA